MKDLVEYFLILGRWLTDAHTDSDWGCSFTFIDHTRTAISNNGLPSKLSVASREGWCGTLAEWSVLRGAGGRSLPNCIWRCSAWSEPYDCRRLHWAGDGAAPRGGCIVYFLARSIWGVLTEGLGSRIHRSLLWNSCLGEAFPRSISLFVSLFGFRNSSSGSQYNIHNSQYSLCPNFTIYKRIAVFSILKIKLNKTSPMLQKIH